jgi:hypothetical protein
VSLKTRSTFFLFEPREILDALVGLKAVRVLRYERFGPAPPRKNFHSQLNLRIQLATSYTSILGGTHRVST